MLDTGYSNVCLRNSQAMGIDLAQVDTIVLSHGHKDHTGGLVPRRDAGLLAGKTVLAHPLCIQPKRLDGQDIGCPFSARELAQSCNLHLSTEPVELTPHLTYLGARSPPHKSLNHGHPSEHTGTAPHGSQIYYWMIPP